MTSKAIEVTGGLQIQSEAIAYTREGREFPLGSEILAQSLLRVACGPSVSGRVPSAGSLAYPGPDMSQLAPLLAKLKASGAERLFFAPDEEGCAFDGEVKQLLPGGPIAAPILLEAISELLSGDDIEALTNRRARTVRHEHEGDQFVIEIFRHDRGVAFGVRAGAKARPLRDSFRKDEGKPPPLLVPTPRGGTPTRSMTKPRLSKRVKAARPSVIISNKRTVRATVDDDGNIIDDVSGEPVMPPPGAALEQQSRIDTKPVKRPGTATSTSERRGSSQRPPPYDKRTVRAMVDDEGNLVEPVDGIPTGPAARDPKRPPEVAIVPASEPGSKRADVAPSAEKRQVVVSLTDGDQARLDRLAVHLDMSTIVRAAFLVGLEVIETQPGVLLGEKPKRR